MWMSHFHECFSGNYLLYNSVSGEPVQSEYSEQLANIMSASLVINILSYKNLENFIDKVKGK